MLFRSEFRCMELTPAFKEVQNNLISLFVATVSNPSSTQDAIQAEIKRSQDEVNVMVDFVK